MLSQPQQNKVIEEVCKIIICARRCCDKEHLASEHNSRFAMDLLLKVTRKYFTTSMTQPCVIHDTVNGHRNLLSGLVPEHSTLNPLLWHFGKMLD